MIELDEPHNQVKTYKCPYEADDNLKLFTVE